MRRMLHIVCGVAVLAATLGATGTAHASPGLRDAIRPSNGAVSSPEPTIPVGEEPATETPAIETPTTEPPATEAPGAVAPSPEERPGTAPESPTPERSDTDATDGTPQTLARATVQTVIEPFGPGTHRLAGADRFATAVEISKRFSPGVPVVYVATGVDFPDALAAAAAAAHRGGPLLLTPPDILPDAVRAEIARLAPARVIVAGGEAVVSAKVFTELSSLSPSIARLAGIDRYETGERIVAEAFASSAEAFIATGRSFPDALAASAAAGAKDMPVILVDGMGESVSSTATGLMRGLGVSTVRIAGGTGAVGTGIERSLETQGFAVERHDGADRFLTAVAINDAIFGPMRPVGSGFLATGAEFADALAGAALAGGVGGPLFVVRQACVPGPVKLGIERLSPSATVLLGGTGALADAVAEVAECPLEWAKPASGRITDGFGPRAPICTPAGCTQSFHRGVDLATGCWAPIYAASAGRVVTAGRVGTYGNFIKIMHDDDTDTGYAHLVDGGVLVSVGQFVDAGQQIGWSGATGAATGCHLHFEVYRFGSQLDPVPFMAERGIVLG